jgi:glycine cleavage system H protein
MWALAQPDGSHRFGLTAYAVRLLQDVYFLDLIIEAGMRLSPRQEVGSIESKKAESSLYAPVGGSVVQLNHDLLQDPSAINLDKYDRGWMFQILPDSLSPLLTPEEYLQHLAAAWEVAQRTIKGQANA